MNMDSATITVFFEVTNVVLEGKPGIAFGESNIHNAFWSFRGRAWVTADVGLEIATS